MGKQRKTKNIDLTVGNITSSLWKFAVPLMLGNVLQQLYNLVDTWAVIISEIMHWQPSVRLTR